jgi:hypothetical protein
MKHQPTFTRNSVYSHGNLLLIFPRTTSKHVQLYTQDTHPHIRQMYLYGSSQLPDAKKLKSKAILVTGREGP